MARREGLQGADPRREMKPRRRWTAATAADDGGQGTPATGVEQRRAFDVKFPARSAMAPSRSAKGGLTQGAQQRGRRPATGRNWRR